MSAEVEWEWVVRRVPPMPKFKSIRQLRALSKKRLAERCWAATVNDDASMQSSSEAWARVAALVEMLEGTRPIDSALLKSLKAHRAHAVTCRTGSCEHEYAALVRAGMEGKAEEARGPEGKREPLADTLCYWTCEIHPWLEWPHDDCPGPGMPVGASLALLKPADHSGARPKGCQ